MRRLVVALAAAALLAVGSAASVMAAPYEAEDTPQTGWMCAGWTGSFGNSDPAANPTLKRMADKIGMSAADLSKELQAGKSVAEVARAKNVNLQSLVDVMIAPQKDMMAIRVKYGFLTQEQADLAVQNMAEVMKSRLEMSGFFGGMMGGMMGAGPMSGGMMGQGMMGGPMGGGMMGGGMTGQGMMGGGMMGRGMMGGGMMGQGVDPGTMNPNSSQSTMPGRGGMAGSAWGWQSRTN